MNIFSKTERLSMKLFCAAVIVAALFLAVRFILPALIPFLIALLIASLIKKPVLSLRAKARIPEKLTAAIFVLLIIGMISMISYLLLSRACREIVSIDSSSRGRPCRRSRIRSSGHWSCIASDSGIWNGRFCRQGTGLPYQMRMCRRCASLLPLSTPHPLKNLLYLPKKEIALR